jgi:hypothetical protein
MAWTSTKTTLATAACFDTQFCAAGPTFSKRNSVVRDSRLMASVPASDIAAPSTASVTVVNPSPGGGTSNVMQSGRQSGASSVENAHSHPFA